MRSIIGIAEAVAAAPKALSTLELAKLRCRTERCWPWDTYKGTQALRM